MNRQDAKHSKKFRYIEAKPDDTDTTSFISGVAYPIYTPFGNEAAAEVLFGALKTAETAHNSVSSDE